MQSDGAAPNYKVNVSESTPSPYISALRPRNPHLGRDSVLPVLSFKHGVPGWGVTRHPEQGVLTLALNQVLAEA